VKIKSLMGGAGEGSIFMKLEMTLDSIGVHVVNLGGRGVFEFFGEGTAVRPPKSEDGKPLESLS